MFKKQYICWLIFCLFIAHWVLCNVYRHCRSFVHEQIVREKPFTAIYAETQDAINLKLCYKAYVCHCMRMRTRVGVRKREKVNESVVHNSCQLTNNTVQASARTECYHKQHHIKCTWPGSARSTKWMISQIDYHYLVDFSTFAGVYVLMHCNAIFLFRNDRYMCNHERNW